MFTDGEPCNPSWFERLATSSLLANQVSEFNVNHAQVTNGLDVAVGIQKGIISMSNPRYAEVWKLLGQLTAYSASGQSGYGACQNPNTTTPPLSPQPLLVLIFRSFFDQIPPELLESARIDGCTEPQVLARIVVPLTRPVLLTGAILVTINVWGDYLWVTIVIQDPHKVTISAGVQQFVSSFGLNVSSGGSVFAALVIATLPMFVLVGFTMRYFVSGLTQGATKL